MAVEITSDTSVALVDSVTGKAFGEVFPSAAHAEDFLRWLGEERPVHADPRTYGPTLLNALRGQWRDERLDEDGDLLEDEDEREPLTPREVEEMRVDHEEHDPDSRYFRR